MYQYILIGSFIIIAPITFIIVKSYSKKTEKKITSSPSPKRRREAIILPYPEPFNLNLYPVDEDLSTLDLYPVDEEP